jgi:hypothetical protein
MPGCAQALHRLDKPGDVAQSGLFGKRGERRRVCRLRLRRRREPQKDEKGAAEKGG